MSCSDALEIPLGVTSVVGSGGKSTLLRALADELVTHGRTVVLATTTHFQPFGGIELIESADEGEVARALARDGVASVGRRAGEGGKLGAGPLVPERLAALADYVLVEADGSRRLPLKAHAGHEPVVPGCSARRVLVIGASGFFGPVDKTVHRVGLFCERAACAPADAATPELVARVVERECAEKILSPDVVVVNQAETPELRAAAARLARHLLEGGLSLPVWAGSVRAHALWRAGGAA